MAHSSNQSHAREPSQQQAIETLSTKLMEIIHHLDPDGSEPNWETLSDPEKLFYRGCVTHLLIFENSVRAALGS